MHAQYISFFHYSDSYIEKFHHPKPDRPTFFWFSDRYHSHHGKFLRSKYLYFFVKNPTKDNIELRARHDDIGFDGLYKHFLWYNQQRASHNTSVPFYQLPDPSILMSFSTMTPDLILEADEHQRNIWTAAKITEIKLLTENDVPYTFTEIPELIKLLPNLPLSVPFMKPLHENEHYLFPNWKPMVTEKMGTWL